MSQAQSELGRQFSRLGPWTTRFTIDGVSYGGDYDPSSDPRLAHFFSSFPSAKSILELGSLEGGHTLQLARHPGVERVVGIEGRQASIERARFALGLLKVGANVEIVQANLEKLDLSHLGHFDAVFCVGILYHMPEPWKLIEQIARVSRGVYIWTHYIKDDQAKHKKKGFRGLVIRESGPTDPLSGLSRTCYWPTLDALQAMLRKYGFTSIKIVNLVADHPDGPAVSLAATIGPSY